MKTWAEHYIDGRELLHLEHEQACKYADFKCSGVTKT